MNRIKILPVLFLFAASPLFAAVTRDTETSSSCASCSSDSFPHDTAAGSNLAVFADAAIYDFNTGTTISSITYNGDALSPVGSVAQDDFRAHTYRRVAPATGSNTAAINLSGAVHLVTTIRTFSGVDQTTPTGTVVTDSNTGSEPLSVAITVGTGGLGYDAGVQAPGGTCTGVTATGSGQTERYDLCETVENLVAGFGSTNSTVGSATHSYTLTAGNGYVAMLAFPINQSASSPASARRRVIVVD